MSVPGHPMSALKGTQQAKQLMAQVSAHKRGKSEEAGESAAVRKREGAADTEVGAKPGDAANTAGADYADPGYQPDKRKRYPLDTPEHVRAAASYFAMPRNRGKYTAAQQREIQARIASAKKKLGVGSESYTDVVNRYSSK